MSQRVKNLPAMQEKGAQSCPTLRDPMNCSPPALLSMEFSGQEYWSGQPFPSPGDLPNPGIKPGPLASQVDSLPSEPPGGALKSRELLVEGIN